MAERDDQGVAIPTGRLNRMARLGGLGTTIAGSVVSGGARALFSGEKPRLNDLILTPANARRVADQLSKMRGAAMKAGQLMSMEARDILPDELAAILERMRSDAYFMPPGQLKQVLIANWGADFMRRFKRFDVRPIAAASIGQVHRAQTRDGRDLAIKVQYPGIRASIDSDIRNLGTVFRASRMIPREVDLDRLLEDARLQLHEEADYHREADALARFGLALADHRDFVVPGLHRDLSTRDILAMDYVPSRPVEDCAQMDQDIRDRLAACLLDLVLYELFVLQDMQTDPNFANYRYQSDSGRIVLLDFGAAQQFPDTLVHQYRALLSTGMAGQTPEALDLMGEIGLVARPLPTRDHALLSQLFDMASEPLQQGGIFDFGTSDLLARMRAAGFRLAGETEAVHVPPAQSLLLQRKVLGSYLLAERLRARVDLGAVFAPYLASPEPSRVAAR